MIRLKMALAATILALATLPGASVSAQEVQVTGPLAGQPAVRNMRLMREGRLLLAPNVGLSLADPYRRSLFFGLQAQYHLTDWLGLGAWGAYGGLGINSALTDEVERIGVTGERNRLSLPSRQGFSDQIGAIQYAAAVQGTFTLLRGKIALFQRAFVDTDFYLLGGAAFVGIEERAETSTQAIEGDAADGFSAAEIAQRYLDSQTARQTRTTITGTFGVGLNLYFNGWSGLSIEWRAMPFAWNFSGTDEGGPDGGFPDGVLDDNDRRFTLNHIFNLGFVFFLPGDPTISD